jgi:hypothetical protein
MNQLTTSGSTEGTSTSGDDFPYKIRRLLPDHYLPVIVRWLLNSRLWSYGKRTTVENVSGCETSGENAA